MELKPLPIFDAQDTQGYAEYMAAKSLLAQYGLVTVFEREYQNQVDAQIEIHELNENLNNAWATNQDNNEIIGTLRGMLADRNRILEHLREHLRRGCHMDDVWEAVEEWEQLPGMEDNFTIP